MMTLSELAQQLGGELIGNDSVFNQLSTDTRALARGNAYLALSGERFDGNDFVSEAIEKGASGAIVSRDLDHEIPLLRVADTHLALGEIAKLNRQRSSATVIALTGSQGKTTVKEMINSILSNRAATLVTHANLNNTIGVSLTLLRLNDEHRFAVVEMGADRAGEICFSVDKTQPNIALITNASAAHIEGFGSLQGIVEGKGEIIEGIHESGTLILNADDPNVEQWIARAASKNVVLFSAGSSEMAVSYSATNCRLDSQGCISFTLLSPAGSQDITLKLLGKHNVANAVAAASAAMQAGATLDDVYTGLKLLKPVAGRLNPLMGINDCCVID
ncbi:MAG: UDP-N-acetylmuramoyl-tripeptide--D-alanyl-D-alanine ligase, partial [Gammaproteobacteria bacterium]|nr:UDP-N-acetylmuramoyl-tripeptide--D-alanyl-D-alanine ligase [Gammaproteobacteria bacterium]